MKSVRKNKNKKIEDKSIHIRIECRKPAYHKVSAQRRSLVQTKEIQGELSVPVPDELKPGKIRIEELHSGLGYDELVVESAKDGCDLWASVEDRCYKFPVILRSKDVDVSIPGSGNAILVNRRMSMNDIVKLVIGVLILGLILTMSVPAEEGRVPRVGVKEFEVKNDIGLENAEQVIPEVLVSKLKETEKYELSERILLEKILEEQQLQMSGLTDEETAAKFGEIYNLDMVVSGSAMQVGSTITISGRLIDTETTQIVEAATVKFNHLDLLEKELRELAYGLAGWSAAEYERMEMEEYLSRSRYGLRVGSAYQVNSTNVEPSSLWAPLSFGLYYHSCLFDLEALGNIPLTSDSSHFTISGTYYPFTRIGFGLAASYLYDDISGEALDKAEGLGYSAEFITVFGGLQYRASKLLRANLYIGPTISGKIEKHSEEGVFREVDTDFSEDPFGNFGVYFNAEYSLNENLSLMLSYLMQSGEGQSFEDADETEYLSSTYLSLSAGYSFSLE